MRTGWFGVIVWLMSVTVMGSAAEAAPAKLRILVVSSYSRDYLWSQDTNQGLCAAFKDFKFLESDDQVAEYTKNDMVETGTVVIKKAWMDTKRKSKREEILATTVGIMDQIKTFKPDLVLLGNDNATNYIGAKLMNTATPVIFWGVIGDPVKYGYIDSFDHPGHNMTGVFKSGYYKESLESLKKLLPGIRTFAVLSDDSETGRAKLKIMERENAKKRLPAELVDKVVTNSFAEWKAGALALAGKADAIFLTNFSTLKEADGSPVDGLKAAAWYLNNIKKPDLSGERHYVQEGVLIAADDSGYKQGYEAGRMVDMVLHRGKAPGDIAVVTPSRGAIMVNRARAQALGIDLTGKDFIEEFVDGSKALEKYPQQ